MKTFLPAIVVLLSSAFALSMAQAETRPILLPTPKKIVWMDGLASFSAKSKTLSCIVNAAASKNAIAEGISQLNERIQSLGAVPIPETRNFDASSNTDTVLWVGTRHDLLKYDNLLGADFHLPAEMCVPDGYVLKCTKIGKRNIVICAGYDARGCYYGLQTLIQLMSAANGTISIPCVDIIDWPTFRIRLVKVASTSDLPANITRWADLLPRYKMNVIGSHFVCPKTAGSWRKPNDTFQNNSETIARSSRTKDTFDPMLYFSPYGKDRGSLLDANLIADYAEIFSNWISKGYKHIVVDFNDWGQYQFLSDEEKTRFKDVADVMTWLTNGVYKEIRPKYPDVGIFSVPAWTQYAGLPDSQLISYCNAIPKDVMVMTTGYRTRSPDITADWLKKWTDAAGRKPFLWDNTIYCHLDKYRELISGVYNFDAYKVNFPPNMPELLAGPGIHLNGSAQRWREPGVLTFLDYMWNPEAYNPDTSLRNAQVLLWGKQAPEAVDIAQQRAAELYEFLFNANKEGSAATADEALAKFNELEKAVKAAAKLIDDPIISDELDSQCLGKAMGILRKVFPEQKNNGEAK